MFSVSLWLREAKKKDTTGDTENTEVAQKIFQSRTPADLPGSATVKNDLSEAF